MLQWECKEEEDERGFRRNKNRTEYLKTNLQNMGHSDETVWIYNSNKMTPKETHVFVWPVLRCKLWSVRRCPWCCTAKDIHLNRKHFWKNSVSPCFYYNGLSYVRICFRNLSMWVRSATVLISGGKSCFKTVWESRLNNFWTACVDIGKCLELSKIRNDSDSDNMCWFDLTVLCLTYITVPSSLSVSPHFLQDTRSKTYRYIMVSLSFVYLL